MSRNNLATAGPPAATTPSSAASDDERPADLTVGTRPDGDPVPVPASAAADPEAPDGTDAADPVEGASPDATATEDEAASPDAGANPDETAAATRRQSGRHRRRRPRARAVRMARIFGLPTVGLPTAIVLLIVCQSPTPDGDSAVTGQATPPTAATSYPMPSLNPGGLPAGYIPASPGTSGDNQIPTGALATAAAATSGATTGLVTLTAAERQLPSPVLAAYEQAATTLTTEQPACHLRWQLLAGIGKVESGNATGRQISTDGTVTPTILGPRLTGASGFARIVDTDHGALDHDTTYDRAVGPMQFLPSTWTGAGRDGNADGRKDPNNIHDAALAAGGYLCAHHRDLTDPAQLTAAIRAYNPSDAYVRAVLAWTTGYTTSAPVGTAPPTAVSTDLGNPQVPVVELSPVQTTPAAAPSTTPPPSCASISLTAGSLKAVITATTLDLTGRYPAATGSGSDADGTVELHTVARDVAGKTVAETDRPVPLKPGDLPVLLTQLPISPLVSPGATTTVTLTLTVAPPGCPTHTLATATISGVSRPGLTSGSPSPADTTSSPPAPTATTAAPTPSPRSYATH